LVKCIVELTEDDDMAMEDKFPRQVC
jgi:hypothetical protein